MGFLFGYRPLIGPGFYLIQKHVAAPAEVSSSAEIIEPGGRITQFVKNE
jgi:hypothetical protein